MKTKYIGVLNDNELIFRENLDELVSIPRLGNLFFEKRFHHEQLNDYKGKELFYHYTPINEKGEKTNIDFGKFEIIEISPDISTRWGKFDKREILIFDKVKNDIKKIDSFIRGDDFIPKELLFVRNYLLKVPDWDIFIELTKTLPSLKTQLERKKKEIERLNQIITELRVG